jgi:hypothetical protein
LTATQIIDQAMQAGGNTSIQAWSLIELNRILREIYRRYEWPFLMVPDETLTTTASQAYTNYSGLSSTLWKVRIMQIRDGTTLYDVTPLKGGFPAYYGDTSRLAASGRPSKYVLDRKNSRFYWADSIPDAAETISLLYQIDESDVALAGTPTLLTHTKNGEQYLYYRLLQSIKLYMGELAEAAAMATLVREKENAMVGERFDEDDLTPQEWGNARYV